MAPVQAVPQALHSSGHISHQLLGAALLGLEVHARQEPGAGVQGHPHAAQQPPASPPVVTCYAAGAMWASAQCLSAHPASAQSFRQAVLLICRLMRAVCGT